MKQLWSKIKDKFRTIWEKTGWENMTIENRMFQVIAVIGTIISLFCLIETLFVSESVLLILALVILFLFMLLSLWLSVLKKRIELASSIFAIFLNVILFPTLFFFSGGLDSGASLWFLLGYFYIFLLLNGIRFWVFLGITVAVDIGVYAVAILYPNILTPPVSIVGAYMDSLYSVVAVGIAIGILLRIEMKLYNREQEIASERAEALEKTSKARNNLFAGMSHEIRTPINTIMGLNELIQRAQPSGEIMDYAGDIENASEMLLSLVNDILDFSRIEMKLLEIIPLEYSSKNMFADLYNMIRIHATKKNLDLQFNIDTQFPSILYGDDKRIKQIALNLLNNAVKYTEKGGVRFEASGEKTPDGQYNLRITVIDTGIGIKKEEIANIYDYFQRVDERKNHMVEGSGLGLSIVKQLVELMDGTIHVDSIYTKGSTFTVVIPQKIVDYTPVGMIRFGDIEEKVKYHYRQKFEAPDARILIVDDNRVNTLVTSRLLASTRMQIYSASSGKECLELTHRKFFHVILMDYVMPDMDGKDTLYAIRNQENGLCKDTPIIALTATSKDEAENMQIADDFDGYLEKPISSDLLEKEILNLLPREIVEYRQEAEEYDVADDNPAVSVRKKKKVRITTDTACDLPKDLLDKNDVRVQNLYIRTKWGRFVDSVEIDSDNLSQYVQMDEVAADGCSVEDFEVFFADNLVDAVDIIHISFASASGVTYSHAIEAAEGFDHVHIFDSENVSAGQAILVLEAARLAALGKSADEIMKKLAEYRNLVDNGFIAMDANLFYKHGYASRFAANICNTLHLHPLLRMKNKRISISGFLAGDKERLWRKYVGMRLRSIRRIDGRIVVLSFANCPSYMKSIVLEEISNRVGFENVIVCKSSFSNAVNVGPESFGFAFYNRE